MKLKVVLILCLLVSACANPTSLDTANAQESLAAYFAYLHEGSYKQASDLYGGDYGNLLDMNPDIAPDDVVSLWQYACEANGFQCLQARSVNFEEQVSSDTWKFLVEFSNLDGSLFTLGPCCGADVSEMPPQTQFEYFVRSTDQGEFLVMTLPVFVP